jgi:hypothetical protein
MFKIILAMMVITITVSGEPCLANQATDLPLQKKVALSDMVFIGTVRQLNYVMSSGGVRGRTALVHIDTPLKGRQKGDVLVAYDTGDTELEPECCETGGIYLFFLASVPDGRYGTVDGPFGIYKIKGMMPTFEWQMAK